MPFALKTLLVATVALLAHAAPAPAQTEAQFRGTFTLDQAASDPMSKIVADGMSKLGRVYRVWPASGLAKKRLQGTNRPYPWIQLQPNGGQLMVKTDTYELTTPANGRLEDWERSKGDLIDVTTRFQSGRLEQSFDAADGRRVNVFTLSPDGNTLTMQVTVTSEKLDSPLTYKMVYRRQ